MASFYNLKTEDRAEIARIDLRLKFMYDGLRLSLHQYILHTFPGLFPEMETQIPEENTVKAQLMHVGEAFYKVYLSMNREKEVLRLKDRLGESGVEISL